MTPKNLGASKKITREQLISNGIAGRFEAKADCQPDGCWNFTGAINSNGYGVVGLSRQTFLAHRVAFALSKGEIPAGRIVCHACDNRKCINPSHLFAGSYCDNMKDAAAKGRMRTKLRPDSVAIIRRRKAAGIPSRTIGMELGITSCYVNYLFRKHK